MPALILTVMLGWSAVLVWRHVLRQDADPALANDRPRFRLNSGTSSRRAFRSYLPRSRKPFMPAEDRPPLASRITCASIEDYAAEGMKGFTILLMQAERRRTQS